MNDKGFTLIEVLIGLSIAVIAAISVSQVIATTNRVIDAGRKTFVATNLAHEGLELTRQLRDNAWLSNPSDRTVWMSQSDLCPSKGLGTYTYAVDPNIAINGHVTQSPNNAQQDLYLDSISLSTGGTYQEWRHSQLGSAPKSGYKRLMTIDCSKATATPPLVAVTATVTWTGSSGLKSISIKELLYNWLP